MSCPELGAGWMRVNLASAPWSLGTCACLSCGSFLSAWWGWRVKRRMPCLRRPPDGPDVGFEFRVLPKYKYAGRAAGHKGNEEGCLGRQEQHGSGGEVQRTRGVWKPKPLWMFGAHSVCVCVRVCDCVRVCVKQEDKFPLEGGGAALGVTCRVPRTRHAHLCFQERRGSTCPPPPGRIPDSKNCKRWGRL